ncbi:MAG: sensor histidine kinase [Velocimicrobium sp.]
MVVWCILGCMCFAIIVIVIVIHYYNYYCDEISNILNHIISKKTWVASSSNCDTRLAKLIHQANKITDMVESDYSKSQDEKEEVKRLISDISHQLKTPLSNIIMYSDLLESNEVSVEKHIEFTKRLKEETCKMDWLLKSLFNMSRLESGIIEFETEELPIKETIIQSISAVFEKACEKKIIIELNDFADRKLIHNRKWTAEAITNILENAIKYSDIGTTITVSLEVREIYSAIVICDQGIGIEQKEYNDIFKRFYRGDKVRAYQGAGIGLYLARLIFTKQGGNITVYSKLGIGSSFSLFLQNCKNKKIVL